MKKDKAANVYKQMQNMTELTARMVFAGNLLRAGRLLETAEKLFQTGDYRMKNAVPNVYVYDLSILLELRRSHPGRLLPANLKAEYVRQINAF
jgi:hypothetical protein